MNADALRDFFAEQSQINQKLGMVDCVTFVAAAVFVGWGRDFRSVLQYRDRRSAVDRLRALGGLRRACDQAMGKRYPVAELEVGDVVWFDRPATIGLLMQGFVAVKMGRAIHRLQIEPQMTGWKTSGC